MVICLTRENMPRHRVVYGLYEVKVLAGEKSELAVYPSAKHRLICDRLSHVALICCAAVEALRQIADADANVSGFPKKCISDPRGVFDVLQEADVCAQKYVHLLLDVNASLHLGGMVAYD